MREEDGNELEYQDELVSGDQTARLIRRDEQQSSKNACGEGSTTSAVARVVCSCRRCLQREPHSNRSYDEDDTWKDSGPPYTVFVSSTKKYDFVRRGSWWSIRSGMARVFRRSPRRASSDNGDTWRDSGPPCIVCVASTKRRRLRSSRRGCVGAGGACSASHTATVRMLKTILGRTRARLVSSARRKEYDSVRRVGRVRKLSVRASLVVELEAERVVV